MDADAQKRAAAARALEFVQPGMRLGLGTGSTAKHFVDLLGERVRAGLKVVGVPTSEATHAQAKACGIALTTLDETPELDLTIDGADEVAPDFSLIKGGGGALLREKIVATASSRMIVIADASKVVKRLGAFPLPVEVVPFGASVTARKIAEVAGALGCTGRMSRRADEYGEPFFTDNGNFIYDCAFGEIPDADALAPALNRIPGVVDNGLFVGIATIAIVGTPSGTDIIEKK